MAHQQWGFNPLPHNKIINCAKVKVLAEDKINVNVYLKFDEGMAENIVGKGENAGNQHFLLFLQCFQKSSFIGVVKSRDCLVKRSSVSVMHYSMEVNT